MRGEVYFNDPDAREAAERRLPERVADPVSVAVGSEVYVRRHRFAELFLDTPMGRSPRFPVSRFYWDATPPTVVDFFGELSASAPRRAEEVATKRAYFASAGIRYLIARDESDEEAIDQQCEALEAVAERPTEIVPPKTAPRRRARKSSTSKEPSA